MTISMMNCMRGSMMIMNKMKRVCKEEFYNFINNYPRRLERDVYGVCDPPAVSYNDFEKFEKWPESIVAQTFLYDDDPNGYYYKPENERKYMIIEGYEYEQ